MSFFKNLHIAANLAISLILISLTLILIYLNFTDVNYQLIIGFDIYHGITAYGNSGDVYTFWGSIVILLAIDFFLASIFYARERVAAYLLAYVSSGLALLLLIIISAIIAIN